MGDSSKSKDSSLEERVKKLAECKNTVVEFILKKGKMHKKEVVFGKIVRCNEEEVHIARGSYDNSKSTKYTGFRMIPYKSILKINTYILEDSYGE